MSEAKRESIEPGPEALAYGQALRKIFAKQSASQNQVAAGIPVHASQLSRYFSGQTIAGRQQVDALIRVVRSGGATVTRAEVLRLDVLRRAAQAASPRQQDRVLALQEQLEDLQGQLDEAEVRAGTFRGQVQGLEGANSRLEDRVGLLQRRVREEERRAGREHWARVKERRQREQAESQAAQAWLWAEEAAMGVEAAEEVWEEVAERAVRAEWGADEAVVRLRAVEQARAEAQTRAERAMQEAEEAVAGLASARNQLAAAAEYARESNARIEDQQEQLRLLRQEVEVLRRQVRQLTEEARRPAFGSVAEPATQVSGVSAHETWQGLSAAEAAGEQRTGLDAAGSAGAGNDLAGLTPSPPTPTPEELLEELGRVPGESAQKPRGRSIREAAARAESGTVDLVTASASQVPLLPDPRVPSRANRPGTAARKSQYSGGRAEARRAAQKSRERNRFSWEEEEKKIWVGLLLNGMITLLLTQLTAFCCLIFHTMLSSGQLPGFREFSLWFLGFLIFLAAVSVVFLSNKAAVRVAAILITICAAVASFGNDSLTLPWLSHSAQKLGVEFAERRDGRSCNTDFCNPDA